MIKATSPREVISAIAEDLEKKSNTRAKASNRGIQEAIAGILLRRKREK